MNDLVVTFAERLAQEARERAHERRQRLEEQSSNLNSPDVRIRVWEKLHGLSLPSDPQHPILDVVASATGLTLAQVKEEQQARGLLHPPASKAQNPAR